MTPAALKAQFENLIGDSFDVTHTYQLMTQAKNKVEMDLKLEILKDVDTTQVANQGDTYTTMKTLNADVRILLNLMVGTIPYFPKPFIRRENFKNSARTYYVNWKNRQFALCGVQGSTQTISQFFLSSTPDITESDADDADIIVWPSEFQPLIAYVMAGIYQGNLDPDDIAIRQSVQQFIQGQAILDSMIGWDQDIKLASMNNQGGFADEEEGAFPGIIDLGMM